MACINEIPVNENNFLRWHVATDVVAPFTGPLGYCGPVPTGFVFDPIAEEEVYGLPVVNGDTLKFCINTPGTLFPNGLDGIGLGLLQNGQLVVPNAGTLYGYERPAGVYVYGDLFVQNLADKLYWPCLYETATNKILYIANPLQGVSRRAWKRDTVLVQFKHPVNVFEYEYVGISGFYNQFRLDCVVHNYKPVMEISKYRDMNKKLHTNTDLLTREYTLETDFVSEATHHAMVAMVICQTLTINNRAYRMAGGYEHTPLETPRELTTGRIALEDIAYTAALSMCKQ